jgi:hypothetical protein
MSERRRDNLSWPQPSNREQLIKYLEAVVRMTEAENGTAGFLLRLVVSTLGRGSGLVQRRAS